MLSIDVDGATLRYVEAGQDMDGTIITLHGGRGVGDHRSDFAAMQALTDRFRVISFDQRGHGQSSLNGPLTFDRLADDVEAIRIALVGKPVMLVAGSFGGMIGLTYALKYPASLSHLVLRGTAPSHHHEEDAIEAFRARLHLAPLASENILRKMFAGEVRDDIERRLISYAIRPLYAEAIKDPDAELERARSMYVHAETNNMLFRDGRTYDVRERLHEIACPTLVVCGAEDWICPPAHSRLMAEHIADAELLIVEGANHAVHVTAADIVLPRIRKLARRGA